jgi:hypothetical protein
MKRRFLYIVLVLAIPALSWGSIGPDTLLEFPVFETAAWDAYRLDFESDWLAGGTRLGSLDLHPVFKNGNKIGRSLNEVHGGISNSGRPSPGNMLSMVSFVWAKVFGGVDVVAEVKDFARQISRKGRPGKASRSKQDDPRNHWRFIVVCRIDQQTEVAALFKNRGRFFGEGNLALEVNALDPMSEEIGLTMAYNDGQLDVRADRMTLTETAAAKLVVKF